MQSTWLDSSKWTSARDAIYSAAPASVQASIDKSGYNYAALTTQDWYTENVPEAQRTDVAREIEAINSAAARIVGTPSTSTGGAMRTAAPMLVGAVGVVGGVWAVL